MPCSRTPRARCHLSIAVFIVLPSTHRTVSATLTSSKITELNHFSLCLRPAFFLSTLNSCCYLQESKTRYRIQLIIGFLIELSSIRECAPHGALCAFVPLCFNYFFDGPVNWRIGKILQSRVIVIMSNKL